MHRREWLCLLICSAMVGCGSVPGQAKSDPPVTKAPRLAQNDKDMGKSSDIQQTSAEKEKGSEENIYRVKFETTVGDFLLEVHRDWAPIGAERFHELVESGFYDGCKFFRVIPNFMVQFGMSGDPEMNKKWQDEKIIDDPVHRSNKKGYITFAKTGAPNSRTTQVFINYKANHNLDDQGFAPFGQIIEGMDVAEKINSLYGERPNQDLIRRKGNEYLEKEFPKLDGIIKATIVPKS